MKKLILLMGLVMVTQFTFAKEQVSPGFDGTLPDGAGGRYPSRIEIMSAMVSQPQFLTYVQKNLDPKMEITELEVLKWPRKPSQPGDLIEMIIKVHYGELANNKSPKERVAGWMTICARLDYTDVPGALADGTKAVKLADQLAYITYPKNGCR